MSSGERRRARLGRLVWTALLAFGLGIWFYPLLASGGARLPGGPHDPRHLNWVLEWHFLCATAEPICERWLSPPVFYPVEETLASTDLMLGQVPPYFAARLAGFGPELAHQATIGVFLAGGFVAGSWFLRAILGAPLAVAGLGAFLFAFGAPRTAQVSHPQLVPFFALPLVLGGLALALGIGVPERPPRRAGWILAAAAFAFLFAASANLAWLFLFWLTLVALAALAVPLCRRTILGALRRDVAVLAAALLLLAALTLPILPLYGDAKASFGAATAFEEQVRPLLPRPVSWIRLGPGSWQGGLLPDLGANLALRWEHSLGIGFVTLLLCLAGAAIGWSDPWGRALTFGSGVAIAVVTAWPGGIEIWRVVHAAVPGAASVRAAGRIALVLLLPAAIALVALWKARAAALPPFALAALALVVVLEQGRAVADRAVGPLRARVDAIARAVPTSCDAWFASIEGGPGNPTLYQINALWATLANGKPTLNGYTSYPPRDWPLWRARLTSPAEIEAQRIALRSWIDRNALHALRICWVREREDPAGGERFVVAAP
jgi:hypothetical protein